MFVTGGSPGVIRELTATGPAVNLQWMSGAKRVKR